MGLEPVWKSHACVLVSDGGAPFQARSDRTPLKRLVRYTTVALKQAHSLRRRMHFDALDEKDYTGTLWGIGERDREPDAGYPNDVRKVIAKVRTDLDRFTEAEQKILENHGYWAAEEQVSLRLPLLVSSGAPGAKAPHPKWMDPQEVRHALRRSHRRLSLMRMLRRP
jgi:NTE family protein